MKIAINDQIKSFPVSLTEVTLGQRIAFDTAHGTALEKRLDEIQQIEDEEFKRISLDMYADEAACCYVSFFTDIPLEVVRTQLNAEVVLALNNVGLGTMTEEETALKQKLRTVFEWNLEMWQLQAPVVTTSSPLTFGEYIDAKQIISDVAKEGGSKWTLLHRVACIFLRRPDEPYEQSMSEPDSDRAKLMLDLPLDIALSVGFFLSSWMDSFKNHSRSSGQDVADQVATLRSILIPGVGFTSSNPLPKRRFSIFRLLGLTQSNVQGKQRRLMFSFLRRKTKSTQKQ